VHLAGNLAGAAFSVCGSLPNPKRRFELIAAKCGGGIGAMIGLDSERCLRRKEQISHETAVYLFTLSILFMQSLTASAHGRYEELSDL
jgi:hypothetical protein